MKKQLIKWVLPAMVLLNACKKDDVTPGPAVAPTKGVYVLSEGGTGSTLSFRSAAGTVTGDFFLQQNPTIVGGLGNLGNDAIIYGGKMYIMMNLSNVVTVLNASTGIFIANIAFPGGPRFAVGTRGKVFVTAYDATVTAIDTTTLTKASPIAVGPNPEGVAVYGNYMYVVNSGGFNPIPDSTVSVIDLNTNLEIKKIVVGVNPQKIEINSLGDAYVSSYGNFSTILPTISVVNCNTNTLKTTLNSDYVYDHLRIFNDIAYFYNNYAGGPVKVYDTRTNTLVRNNFITDGTTIQVSYGVDVDEENGDVYIADAKNFITAGQVTCFSKDGVKKFHFSVSPGVNPNKIVFLR